MNVPRIVSALLLAALLGFASSSEAGAVNVFVTGQDQNIREYTTSGVLVRTIPVPIPSGGDAGVRGTVVGEDGRIHVLNGTFDPWLSTYDPLTMSWSHRTHPGFSLVNNGSYGAITVFGQYVYAPDMQTFGSGEDQLNGIIRFDLLNGTATRYEHASGPGYGFINLARGLDGWLYALGTGGSTEGSFVRVYDPFTMEFQRQVNLAQSVRGIVVDAAGNLYGGSWSGVIYGFTPDGAVAHSIAPGGNISDLDLLPDGSIVAGNWFNSTYLTTTALSSVTSFPITGDGEFVTFAVPIPEPVFWGWVAFARWLPMRRGKRRAR